MRAWQLTDFTRYYFNIRRQFLKLMLITAWLVNKVDLLSAN